ncbi:uncharacterized protein LOC110176481 [Drosophila serrata]|uniref:uncharacterized protein LOC110176481 n=1 Tax=Drosophila serrata TaxID=7274 RepID=UPI000A1D2055|nr:uncharacterized protein LOC110176481 [Drosophila serrata]
MLKRNNQVILTGLVTLMVTFGFIPTIEAASKAPDINLGLISISDTSDMCQYSPLLSYSCCQSVTVNMLNDTKKFCLNFKADILGGKVDLSTTMDGVSLGKFNIDINKPPTICLPLISTMGLNMCLKLNFSLSSSGAKICPNVYSSYNTNDIMTYTFPCVQVGLDGVSLV